MTTIITPEAKLQQALERNIKGVNTVTTIITPEEIAKSYPDQRLSLFRDRDTDELVRFKGKQGKKYAVFYIGSDGQKFCWHCANQVDADPPIVAAQLNGDKPHDELVQCGGCGSSIWPMFLIEQKNCIFMHVRGEDGAWTMLCISYETPVAIYDFRDDSFFETDINWSSSTGKHVSEFQWHIREMKAEAAGVERYTIEYQRPEPLAQETLDERLKVYIGGIRLPSKRDADSYTHQPRLTTAALNYDQVRADLRAAKTDKVVIKPNRRRRRSF